MKFYVGEYLAFLGAKGYSPTTVERIERDLKYFFKFQEKKEKIQIGEAEILEYRDYLIEEYETNEGHKLSKESINLKGLSLRGYFRYLTEEKKIYLFDPSRQWERIEGERRIPVKIVSSKEISSLMDRVSVRTLAEKRDKAILELIYSSGLRRNELLNLDVYDFDLANKEIRIRNGKGGKDRVVPVGEKALESLRRYLESTRIKFKKKQMGESALFLSNRGIRLTKSTIQHIVRKYRGRLPLTVHGLRHACAIGMLSGGADIRYIQELLGHSHIRTTQIYTQVLPEDLKAAHKKYHPGAKARIERGKGRA